MDKDYSDIYYSGVVQQNALSQVSSIQKNVDNSSNPKSMMSRDTNVKQSRDKEAGLFVRVQKE